MKLTARRWGWVLLGTMWMGSLVPAAGGAERAEPWYRRSLTGMEVGPTGAQFGNSDPSDARYCARFDGAEIVRRCAAAGCEYVVLWVRDGDYAYYDSKRLMKCPGLGSRDPLRDAVAEARRQRLPLIAYCVVQQNGHYLAAHPEFEMRDAQGRRIGRFCYNSGYLEAMKEIVAEQLAYGIDGFHIDMIDQGFGPPYGCWCDTCRSQFEAEYHHPLPKGATWDAGWDEMLEFRYRSSERFERALYAHIKSLNPLASVDFNYHGNPPFSWEVGQRPVQHAGNSDFVTGETGMWGFSAATVGLNAEFYRASTPGQPFQIAISRDARCYHNQTVRPLADLRWEVFALLAHGGFVTVVDKLGFEGWLDPVCYQRLGLVFKEARAKRATFSGRPLQEVGIYFSSRTRDWVGRDKPGDYFQGFQGAHKAMLYEHIPWGIVLDENLTLARLQQFAVVLLPNAGICSERELALWREYVMAGGHLILTGLTGAYSRTGEFQNRSVLEELSGARLRKQLDSLDNWVTFANCAADSTGLKLAPPDRRDSPFLVKGPAVELEPTTATAYGELQRPYRTTRQRERKEGTEWPMSPEATVGPAVLIHPLGKGSVLTFACSPDYATASEHHIPEARQLLAQAVRLLNPAPRLRITAPVSVEAVVIEDPAARLLRLHLVSYASPPQTMPADRRPYVLPALVEDSPIYRVTVELPAACKRASAFNPATAIRRRGKQLEARVEDIHEVISIRY